MCLSRVDQFAITKMASEFTSKQTKAADVDLVRLELFNPTTGKEELVESDPMKRVDFGNALVFGSFR